MGRKQACTFCFGKANLQHSCWTPGNSSHLSIPCSDVFATASHQKRIWSGYMSAQQWPAKLRHTHQTHTTTMPPPAARPFLPGRHTNTRDAGAGRNPWFFLQLQRHGYTKCLCKRHPAQNRSNRNRRATETMLACSTDEIPFKCLRWNHSSTWLLDSPFSPLPFITRLFVKLTVP